MDTRGTCSNRFLPTNALIHDFSYYLKGVTDTLTFRIMNDTV